MIRFIDEKKDNWQRLEDLLGLLSGSSLRGLSRMEVREFGRLYRRAAADLAVARAETRDPRLINYLNSLVIRAHGKIYRAEGEGMGVLSRFLRSEFPRAFRHILPYTLLAFGLFSFFAIGSFVLSYYDPSFANLLGLDQIERDAGADFRWWLRLNEANQVGSAAILTNNIGVTFLAFAFGPFLGIGTIYVLINNGLLIGGILGVVYRVNPAMANDLVAFMAGHGVIELSCIFIGAGAGLSIGHAIVAPGNLSRAEALKYRGREAARIVIGCALLLVVAGTIEGFLSPSGLPALVKLGTGLLTGVAMFTYLFRSGKTPEPRDATTAPAIT